MRHCYVLRVFTRQGEGGNHLGVVPDVTGLTRDGMQSIATELGFSETVFLDWREGGTPYARIFTPATELPFAGHPLVGAAWVLTRMGPGGPDRIECGVGEVEIRNVDDATWIHPLFEQTVSESSGDIGDRLGAVHACVVAMPLPYTVLELRTPQDVSMIGRPPESGFIYVWAWEERGVRVRARFFAREHGVVEDPATGSAAVAFAASMRARGEPSGSVFIHQGQEMGYPSRIELRWDEGGVHVGGEVAREELRVLDV